MSAARTTRSRESDRRRTIGNGMAGEEVGVMHACGHDVHVTTMIGTARALAATRTISEGRVMGPLQWPGVEMRRALRAGDPSRTHILILAAAHRSGDRAIGSAARRPPF